MFEYVNCFGSLGIVILSKFLESLFAAVCSLVLQSIGVYILDSKAGYVSKDCVEPSVES